MIVCRRYRGEALSSSCFFFLREGSGVNKTFDVTYPYVATDGAKLFRESKGIFWQMVHEILFICNVFDFF